jgi:hypothetical protein
MIRRRLPSFVRSDQREHSMAHPSDGSEPTGWLTAVGLGKMETTPRLRAMRRAAPACAESRSEASRLRPTNVHDKPLRVGPSCWRRPRPSLGSCESGPRFREGRRPRAKRPAFTFPKSRGSASRPPAGAAAPETASASGAPIRAQTVEGPPSTSTAWLDSEPPLP